LESPIFLVNRYYPAFLKGDEVGMKREIERAHGNLEAEDWMTHNQALVLACPGRWDLVAREARRLARKRSGPDEVAASLEFLRHTPKGAQAGLSGKKRSARTRRSCPSFETGKHSEEATRLDMPSTNMGCFWNG